MKVIFCEECGGKNNVEAEQLDRVDEQPPVCQICGNIMSSETIIPHGSSASTVDTKQYHLLLIDDDMFHLELMKAILEKEYQVSNAFTGASGLELAEDIQPDLILLDVNMPGMDGYETCKRLKENRKTRHIPIIFISAMSENQDEYKGLSLGAVDYINKPVNREVLNARISLQIRLKLLLDQHRSEADSLVKSLQKSSLQAEQEQETILRDRNSFLSILDSLDEEVTVQDQDMNIVWANRAALQNYDLNFSDVVDKKCYEALVKRDQSCPDCPVTKGLGGNLTIDIEGCEKDCASCRMGHIPFFDDEGELQGMGHIIRQSSTEEIAPDLKPGQNSSTALSTDNKDQIKGYLSEILFSIDAISSMYREDKQLGEVKQTLGRAAEQLDELIDKLLS